VRNFSRFVLIYSFEIIGFRKFILKIIFDVTHIVG